MNDNAILAVMRSMGIPQDGMSRHGFLEMARTILDEVLGMRPITSNTNLSTPCATRTGAPTTALRTCPAPHRPNSLLVDEASLQGEPGIAKLT